MKADVYSSVRRLHSGFASAINACCGSGGESSPFSRANVEGGLGGSRHIAQLVAVPCRRAVVRVQAEAVVPCALLREGHQPRSLLTLYSG